MSKKPPYQSGSSRKAHADKGYVYEYFLPSLLPESLELNDPKIGLLLEEATHHLGELNAYAKLVPDIGFFIKMHEVKEATQSSLIEGTKTEIDEAVMRAEDVDPERRDDWQEVQNYVAAMKYAIAGLDKLPLATRLLKNTHRVLMQGVRGEHKSPGEIRRTQNWIGGATIKDARFIPPAVEELPALLSDLDNYWHTKATNTPHLIKAGVSHYQFETIHPFLDGNGRLGRLLIVLYLTEKKLLHRPILYLSEFFAKHREEYYDALNAVRYNGDMSHWVKFFLVAVSETAQKACSTLQAIIDLKAKDSQTILALGKRAPQAARLLNNMYAQPILTVNQAAELLGVTHQTANSLIAELVRLGILEEITRASRNRLFVYNDYIGLFR